MIWLRRLDGCKVMFLEIKECYIVIENDFKVGVRGVGDICFEMFFEFYGVRKRVNVNFCY